ncbi:hypothetical protein SSBR45G_37260 [Bradyrhizobium sp. SSBR45G]|uniref:hypothetical protein n=1 Tax=unclassified Bradyrhizobium TaxID=2631580 RepID=UPI0023428F48|nr:MULTISPECIES: hypothetical protein [unclassified Bradyrhizobium]GLH78817.1 hypothetical protein SSBR45G_37260 [Bradyrhizobium sp. SSBR45G]GLH86469.1 hypothetical protein SSBR45R_39290 [Bradyrhizobium sp. SSBR45R]
MDVLDLLIRLLAVLIDVRGHIPQSGGFESFRDDSTPTGLFGHIALFLTTMFCIAAAVAFVVLLSVRWLS